MIRINPVKVFVGGDIYKARTFIGNAKSQLNILSQDMGFQNLTQGNRKLWLNEETHVECIKIFNLQIVKIFVVPSGNLESSEELSENGLLVVYGNKETELTMRNLTGVFVADENLIYYNNNDVITIGKIDFIDGNNFYGQFAAVPDIETKIYGQTSGAFGTFEGCLRSYYQRNYEYQEIINSSFNSSGTNFSFNNAFEVSIVGNQSCFFRRQVVLQEWSKVYDDLIVVVYIYFDLDLLTTLWGVTASYSNQPVTINNLFEYKNLIRTRVYNSGGDLSDTHCGFDVWAENEDNNTNYYLGIISDSGEFVSFLLDTDALNFTINNSFQSTIRTNEDIAYNVFPESIRDLHTFLLGYGHSDNNDYAWWGMPGFAEGNFSSYYYRENLSTGELTEYNINSSTEQNNSLHSALWHPIERKLYIMADASEETNTTEGTFSFNYNFKQVCVSHTSGINCCWEGPDLTPTSPEGWYCADAPFPDSPIAQITFLLTVFNTDHYYPAYFYDYATNYPSTYNIGTSWEGIMKKELLETDYGNFIIGENIYAQGISNQYTVTNYSIGMNQYTTNPGDIKNITNDGNFSHTECQPQSVSNHSFNNWIWDNKGGIAYSITKNMLSTEETEEGNIICVWEDVFEEITSGDSNLILIDNDTFPYDFGWTSILFHGVDANNILHENDVIYINSNNEFFIRSNLVESYFIGEYDRAYFTQYEQDNFLEV